MTPETLGLVALSGTVLFVIVICLNLLVTALAAGAKPTHDRDREVDA